MERAFGLDFSEMRLSVARPPAGSPDRTSAWQQGDQIGLSPATWSHPQERRRALAHELAHIAQLRGGTGGGPSLAEASAEQAAARVLAGQSAGAVAGRPAQPAFRAVGVDGPSVWEVQPGDTLWRIAEVTYGDGHLWPAIRDANPTLVADNGDLIRPGARLSLPDNPHVGAMTASSDWTVEGVVSLLVQGGRRDLVERIERERIPVASFTYAYSKWRMPDGRVERREAKKLAGLWDPSSGTLLLYLHLTNAEAALKVVHEIGHINQATTDRVESEVEVRVPEEQFAIDADLPPGLSAARTPDGRVNEPGIRDWVEHHSPYVPTDGSVRIDTIYLGRAPRDVGWHVPP